MTYYYRQRQSTYANYRYSNPNSASFIAPQGKVANFMLENLMHMPDPETLRAAMQGVGDAWNGAKSFVGGHVPQMPNMTLPQMPEGIMQGVGDAWNGVKGGAAGAWNGVAGAAGDAWGGIKSNVGNMLPGHVGPNGPLSGAEVFDATVAGARDAVGRAASAAGQYAGDHKAALGAGGAGVAGGGGALAWLRGRGRRAAQAAAEVADPVANPGMLQRLKNMPMAGKIAAGGAGLAGLGGLGYAAAQGMQGSPEEAAYRAYYNAANFNRYYR